MRSFLHRHWPTLLLSFLLLFVISRNVHPGKLILGNDNFSPELNPTLTLSRSFLNPAWRSYRILGVPSDSEQADWWRAGIFATLAPLIPQWLLSQGYIFLTLAIATLSMAKLAGLFVKKNKQIIEFSSGLLYLTSLITLWVYIYPVQLFVAAYAFAPLVLWRLICSIKKPSWKNNLLLLISSIMLGTAALTATIFLVIICFVMSVAAMQALVDRTKLKPALIALAIVILPHLFWIPTFAMYVHSNAGALQDSYINRDITTSTYQSEQTNNTIPNVLRFANAWLDTKENGTSYTYTYHDWFRSNPIGINLGYLAPVLGGIGILLALWNWRHDSVITLLIPIPIVGLFLMKGTNPPFDQFFLWLDAHIPLFHQVFRWGSSKFWPLLAIPIPIFAGYTLAKLLTNKWLKVVALPGITLAMLVYAYPLVSGSLIRPDAFVTVPTEYSDLKSQVSATPFDRIETSPDTNTRYFRKYDWGFWGSVFLNYLLPNPTSEKALVIGSYENEQAYNVTDTLYYTGKTAAYANSLGRYNVSEILSDHTTTNSGLDNSYSFPYDWGLQTKMVDANPSFSKMWQSNFLSLYKNNTTTQWVASPMVPHNWTSLNSILALENNTNPYYQGQQGSIVPLALPFTSFTATPNTLTLTAPIPITETTLYQLNDLNAYDHLAVSRSQNKLVIYPYLPTLTDNGETIFTPPTFNTEIQPETIISAGGEIVTPRNNIIIPAANKKVSLTAWQDPKSTRPPLGRLRLTDCMSTNQGPGTTTEANGSITATVEGKSCLAADSDITTTGAITSSFAVSASHPVTIVPCIHSYLRNQCINTPTAIFITASQTISIPLNYIVEKGDNLQLFLTITPAEPTTLVVSNYTLTNWAKSSMIPVEPTFIITHPTVTLNPQDILELSLPLPSKVINYPISLLDSFQSFCPKRGTLTYPLTSLPHKGITLASNNCFDGVYGSLGSVDGGVYPLLLITGSATNHSGIPLTLNIKQEGKARKPFTDLFRENQTSSIISLLSLPTGDNAYTAEVMNQGIGKTDSVNTLSALTLLPIPAEWLSLSLTPTNGKTLPITELSPIITNADTGVYVGHVTTDSVIVIPQAVSPYWGVFTVSQKPSVLTSYWYALTHPSLSGATRVNGWQQAWVVKSTDPNTWYVVVFIPNLVAYVGLFIGLGIAFVLIAVKQPTKTASTHKGE